MERTNTLLIKLVSVISFSCCLVMATPLNASIKKENLPKGVKEVIETRYRFVRREEEYRQRLKGHSIFKYNERGREIEWADYDKNGSLVAQYIPKYDNKGALSEGYWYRASGQTYWESIEIFDKEDKPDPQEELNRNYGGKTVSKYDNEGNEIERVLYNPDGCLLYKYRYRYDNKRNKIMVARYKIDGTLDYKYTYKYDDKRQLIKWARYQADGSLDFKYSYQYDKKGQISEMVEYDITGTIVSKSYPKYNDKGKVIEWEIYDTADNLQTKTTFRYDIEGNRIEEKRYDYRKEFGKVKEIPIEMITWQYKYFYDEE